MKYWWLKKYKDLKLEYIADLKRDVNYYIVVPKNYYERYLIIKNSDVDSLNEEDLLISLYSILCHEKIKNNRILLIINKLLEYPDNSLPSTNYSLNEMLDEVKNLKNIYPLQEKLESNNIAACYHCLNVFYVDKIKYVNKKGYCLCPYCKSHNIYFDNDFIPMDYNFLKLAKFYYDNTNLGCKFIHLQKLLKRCVILKKDNVDINNYKNSALIVKNSEDSCELLGDKMVFNMKEISFKKEITSKEEMTINYKFNECFSKIERSMIKDVIIDTSIINSDKRFNLYLSFILTILDNLGRNQYLKRIVLICNDDKAYNILKDFIKIIVNYG